MSNFPNEDYELESRRHQYRMSRGYRPPLGRDSRDEKPPLVVEEYEDGLVHAHRPEKLRETEQ